MLHKLLAQYTQHCLLVLLGMTRKQCAGLNCALHALQLPSAISCMNRGMYHAGEAEAEACLTHRQAKGPGDVT